MALRLCVSNWENINHASALRTLFLQKLRSREYRTKGTWPLLWCDPEQWFEARTQIKQAQAPITAAGQQHWRLCACTATAIQQRFTFRNADADAHDS